MKLLDYLYANICSWYYNMVANGRKVNPQSATSLMFSICFIGWFIFFCTVIFVYFKNPTY